MLSYSFTIKIAKLYVISKEKYLQHAIPMTTFGDDLIKNENIKEDFK